MLFKNLLSPGTKFQKRQSAIKIRDTKDKFNRHLSYRFLYLRKNLKKTFPIFLTLLFPRK